MFRLDRITALQELEHYRPEKDQTLRAFYETEAYRH